MSARRAALCPPRARSYFFASSFFGSPSENERSREYRTVVLLLAGGTRFLNFLCLYLQSASSSPCRQ